MRKKKPTDLLASRSMTTMPPSFHEYLKAHGGVSQAIQQLVAASINGITLEQLEALYTPEYGGVDVRSKRDDWSKEYLRMARWLTEGQLLYFELEEKTNDLLLYVHWTKSQEAVTCVRVSSKFSGFVHVCYDLVEPKRFLGETELLFGLATNRYTLASEFNTFDWTALAQHMHPTKIQVIKRWCISSLSTVYTEKGKQFKDPDITASLYMLPVPSQKEGV